ncbi:hypothetical protein AU210_002581 [Fusarium oxysporum f. sp. radicis-cucumerinum]|uniref:Uncharacterized protein n=2 Tax=Fusarium oxysporum TaxID=5507 RepID=A0A2H3HMZ9_FUSOX|nr:hypothetical protein AU210_002581 [Fusarium oxysporum f. sp. radicis-cucumerinum]RKK18312.1 hypothetical protein BFJ65_g8617 [Fusarium oxysporum f. sp. cepae]RKK45860.1 hypothetical protein BFJ67_g8528 [Fusarium oxysporum f. sp. cepae]RKK50742.1 hypothetical protein BFJ66_g6447 [Fusarium oxysporum f. sp. cepae]
MWTLLNKPKLPQVTGQASSRPDELSFVILGTSSVEAAEIASLLEAELRQAHHRYKHCTVASPAACLAALKANSATHVFVIFDDVVGDIEDTVSDEFCDEKTLGIAAKSAIIKFCVNRGIHCTFFSHENFYRHDGRNCFCDSGFEEEAELNIKLLPNSLSTYVFHQVSTVAPLSLLKLMQWPASSTQARKRRLRSPVWDHNTQSFLQNYERTLVRTNNKHNSWSVLHDLLPAAVFLAIHKVTGTFNFTNPGTATNYSVLALLRDELNLKMSLTMLQDLDLRDA